MEHRPIREPARARIAMPQSQINSTFRYPMKFVSIALKIGLDTAALFVDCDGQIIDMHHQVADSAQQGILTSHRLPACGGQ